jgi:hypothetical protein
MDWAFNVFSLNVEFVLYDVCLPPKRVALSAEATFSECLQAFRHRVVSGPS